MNWRDAVRPKSLDDFVGQEAATATLRSLIASATAQSSALDHMLLVGQPGSGRTALAHVVANELGVGLKATRAGAIERPGDFAAILTNLRQGDVLLLEDIHSLQTSTAEVLAQAMGDSVLDIVIGKGPGARSVRLTLPRFTIVGTTHLSALMPSPVAHAFPLVFRFQEYSVSELGAIAEQVADRLDLGLDPETRQTIASLSKGLPRRALHLLYHWSQLSDRHGGNLSHSETIARLSQLSESYQSISEAARPEQEPIVTYVEQLLHQLESQLEERLDQLEARVKEVESKADEWFGG